jgi:hypothetical protein
MRMGRDLTAIVVAIGLAALPVAALAQKGAAIPNQSWYPAGYVDFKFAAASQHEAFPPGAGVLEDWENPGQSSYDVIDCSFGFYDVPDDMEEKERNLAALAIEVERLRRQLDMSGYPAAVYEQPLLDFERGEITAIVNARADADPDAHMTSQWESYAALAQAMEARRARLSPDKPRIYSEGGCGAGESEFAIRMVPANGELWLINAFAFRVCERKVANPWDHGVCRGWTQFVEGDTTFAAGRYMFEARWGGTVKRGARLLEGDPADEDVTQITFRRN